MARTYWRVSPAFWADEKSSRWSDDAKLLALYILTCEHRSLEGLFRLPKGYIKEDLGWNSERLAEPFAQLLQDGFIEYDEAARVIFIVNALEYQAPENPNQVTAAVKIIEELPATSLITRLYAQSERLCERLAKALQERFGQRLGEGLGKPPALTPALTPALDPSGGAPFSGATPVDNSEAEGAFADVDFGDEEPEPEEQEPKADTRTPGQQLVGYYVDERTKAGSKPTDRQRGIVADVIGQKLRGGSKPENVREAIRRMIAKGKAPSMLPAFVDEVEAERHVMRPRSTVPDFREPTPDERAASLEAARKAREQVQAMAAGIGRGMP